MSQIFISRDGIYECEDDGASRLLCRDFASLDPARRYLWADRSGRLLCVTRGEFKRLRRAALRHGVGALCLLGASLVASYVLLFCLAWLLWRTFR